MKDISFVVPPSPGKKKIIRLIDCSHETKANYLWQPNDFMIISSLLAPEDTVALVDGTCDSLDGPSFLNEVAGLKGDVIFFALSSACWDSDRDFLRKTRQLFPDTPVFVIGDIFLEEYYREIILKESDGIVFHPYMLDIDKMIGCRKNKDVLPGVCTDAKDEVLSRSKQMTHVTGNIPRHEVFLKSGYRFPFARHFKFATVTTMWGCPFACSYCSDSRIPPAVRTADAIIAELDYIERLGVRELFFADKTFGFFHKTSFPLLEEMAGRFHFSWACYFHPQTYDPKLLDLMKSAGCHTIIIGIDSANISSLKQYNRNVSQDKLEMLIDHANRLELDICADFILGLEHESEEDIVNTLEYALKIPISFASFNIAAPLPGSAIREKALKEGKLLLGQEGFDTLGNSGVLGNKNIDREKVRKLRGNAVRRFYLRPSYLLKRLKRTSSFEHLLIQLAEMMSLFKKA